MKQSFMFFLCIGFIIFLNSKVNAQQKRIITGEVIEFETGIKVAGVIVKVKGSENICITDYEGRYTLKIPDTIRTIEFSNFDNRNIRELVKKGDIINIFLSKKEESDFFEMTLEELMNVEIVSASNTKEKLSDAPASAIIITSEEMQERGYTELLDLFDDLPEIDLAVTRGDLYYKAYWRGYRKGAASPFLLMINGQVMNHLWFNWTDVLVAIPMSNIKQVEIVYGPASSVYGANAMMGVMNIITKKDIEENGVNVTSKITAGSFDTKVVDMNFFYKKDELRASFTGYFNMGNMDEDALENYEYTKNKYVSDRNLWGGFIDNSNIAGISSSPKNHRGISLNLFYGNNEIGAEFYKVDGRNGVDYAYDKVQPMSQWIEEDYNFYFKNTTSINSKIQSSSLIRYRHSDVPNKSTSVEGWGGYGEKRVINFGFWQSLNHSWSAFQDFDININNDLAIKIGAKFEKKSLQRAYDFAYGEATAPEDLVYKDYVFPTPPVAVEKVNNRIFWEDIGVYLQTKYNFAPLLNIKNSKHFINIGGRWDDNSAYGDNLTFRAGYVGHIKSFTLKLLYGEAIQEPAPRQLYGSWSGQGVAPDLEPEYSSTIEGSVAYTSKNISIATNVYRIRAEKTINSIKSVPTNIGNRDMLGASLKVNYQNTIFENLKLRTWYYLSYIKTNEEKFDADGIQIDDDEIGDIAPYKMSYGLNFMYKNRLTFNLRGRYIYERKTVASNPLGFVKAYNTLDANITYKNIFVKGFSISFIVKNLLDEQYFHPGIRNADAGNIPGYWDNDKNWYGSQGWSNSLLPQAGRQFLVSLMLNIE